VWHAIRHTTLTDGLATSHTLVHAEFKRILGTIAPERLRRHSMTAIFAIVWCIWHMLRVEDENIARFIIPDQQVLDTAGFRTSLGVPYREDGFGMQSDYVCTRSDAVKLGQFAVDGWTVPALGAYALANRHG